MLLLEDLNDIISAFDVVKYDSYANEIQRNLVIKEKSTNYSLWQTPFFRFIFDCVEDEKIEVIGLMLPSQIGKSQLEIAIALEYARRNPGTLALIYTPNETEASTLANKKLIPCAKDSSVYMKLIKEDKNGGKSRTAITKNSIKFINGSEVMVLGAGGKTSLVSKTSPLVILDEYSSMADISKRKGDVLEMAKTRTTAYSYGNRKVVAASTPLDANETIHKLHLESRQYTWMVPCPSCGEFQYLSFDNLKWNKPEEEVSNRVLADMIKSERLKVYYECPHCNYQLEEKDKLKVLNEGRAECVGNEHLSTKQISLQLNGLYNLSKWSDIVGRFLEAQGDILKLQQFKTQVLAAPWEEATKSKKLKIESIKVADIPKKQIPEDTYKLIAGIDVQHDRFYFVTLAYTRKHKIHLVDWGEEPFNLEDAYNPSSFPFRLEERIYGDGKTVEMMAIDTADNTSITFELTRRLNRAQAIKGYDKAKYSNQYYYTSKTQPDLVFVPRQETNELLETFINSKDFIIPCGLVEDEELFSHLTSVQKIGGKWKNGSGRRDYRDAIRYALSLIMMFKFRDELEEEEYKEKNKETLEKERADRDYELKKMFRL